MLFALALHVEGNRLVHAGGQPVLLHGTQMPARRHASAGICTSATAGKQPDYRSLAIGLDRQAHLADPNILVLSSVRSSIQCIGLRNFRFEDMLLTLGGLPARILSAGPHPTWEHDQP